MKNHKLVNSKLIQINKTFSHLKMEQREWIYSILKERHIQLSNEHNGYVSKSLQTELLEDVYEQIQQKDIWIPLREVQKFYNRKKSKWQ